MKNQSNRSERTQRRLIAVETRVIDAAQGIVEYVASDQTVDHQRESIRVDGWRFSMFAKNAPFVDSHNYWSIEYLLGEVTGWEVRDGALVERVRWAKDTDSPLARVGWQMTEGGFLKAVSVGFVPVRWVTRSESEDFTRTCDAMGFGQAERDRLRLIYLEQEQLELSSCILGCNPNALQRAVREKCVSEKDLDLLGFGGTEERDFLEAAADWQTRGGEFTGEMAERMEAEMRTIFRQRRGRRAEAAPGRSRTGGGGAPGDGGARQRSGGGNDGGGGGRSAFLLELEKQCL